MMEKQHIIYKVTNTLNNRFYVGMHTGFPDDQYFGSGKRLKAEIKKYGKQYFKKEILEVLPDRESLRIRESQIVNEQLRSNPLCLNLKNGGEGGWEYVNSSGANIRNDFPRDEDYKMKMSKAKTGTVCSQEHRQKISDNAPMKNPEAVRKMQKALSGKEKSEAHKQAISERIKQWHAARKAAHKQEEKTSTRQAQNPSP